MDLARVSGGWAGLSVASKLTWTCISLMSQTLALRSSHVMAIEPAGIKRKMSVFWAVYILKKSVVIP
jgi:hypothetical protein